MITKVLFGAFLLFTTAVHAQQPFCAANLGEFAVHETNKPRFGTPIATGPDGGVYITFITPDLKTVITKYEPTTKTWSSPTVLTEKTTADGYHTQPSLGIDFNGFIHAAYNMHNTPWQYSVSEYQHTVSKMIFKGQPAGTTPGAGTPGKAGCTGTCEENWNKDEPGIAAIPGNQITYPTFGNTLDGDLYVGHRECFLCGEKFHDRQWSAGISRYDANKKVWSRVAETRPWSTQPDKISLAMKLVGDHTGRLHASWLWCNKYTDDEGGQACFAHPNFISYASTGDNGNTWVDSTNRTLTLPLTAAQSEVVTGPEWFDRVHATGYYSGNTTLSVDNKKKPTIVVFPNTTDSDKGIRRGSVTLTSDGWSSVKSLDYSPSLVYKDQQGRWIAVSNGLRIHISVDDGQTWKLYPLDLDRGSFTYSHDRLWLMRSGQLRLYAQTEENRLVIWSLTFLESGSCQHETQ